MRTLRLAVRLLASADSLTGLLPLATALGFTGPSQSLDRATRARLGIDPLVRRAAVMNGSGTLRALLIELAPGLSTRDAVARLALSLSLSAPHLLLLLLCTSAEHGDVAVAAWVPGAGKSRVSALVSRREKVVASDAETLVALQGVGAQSGDGNDLLVQARWTELLGRDSLTRRFYRTLERVVRQLADGGRGAAPAERAELALLHMSRLLFLSFLETRGWLDGDTGFLHRGFAECVANGGDYERRVLRPLFFGTLNTPMASRAPVARAFGRVPFLNGGLFARTPLERRTRGASFPDEALSLVFDELLSRYRFTPHEESTTWMEAAVDPEMLGKAFESLMVSRERRSSGAYYTPHMLVSATTSAALRHALADGARLPPPLVEQALRGEVEDPVVLASLLAKLRHLTVLDPSCGSGAFLVHALEAIAALRSRCGDVRATGAIRREVLSRSIFGVDVNPTAVWLCELRLWLSVAIAEDVADPMKVLPLPNLDRHIRVGDALAGPEPCTSCTSGARILLRLRERYTRASGARKRTLERALVREERRSAMNSLESAATRIAAQRKDLLTSLRSRDLWGSRNPPAEPDRARLEIMRRRARELRTLRARAAAGAALDFSFATHFSDIAACGGFTVAIGNPPWVRPHNLHASARDRLRERFDVMRVGGWRRGAEMAGAGRGFAAQGDLAAPFVERALSVLAPGGTLAMLLPAKLWRSLAGGALRAHVLQHALPLALEDWSESPPTFDAAVYPSLLVARKLGGDSPREDSGLDSAVHLGAGAVRWKTITGRLPLDQDPASPWLLVPPEVRAAFDRLQSAGQPLAESVFGRPLLGVKCGCNEAFIVSRECDTRVSGSSVVRVRSNGRYGWVEGFMLRPLLRGESITPWRTRRDAECIIWTHDVNGAALQELPASASRWLGHWRHTLRARSDARGARWWSLFRTPGAASDLPRVVWADVGRRPRAIVLHAGDVTVPLNSCYVARAPSLTDARALAALLNSNVAAAWLALLAEPARGGYRRYLGWTMALLPLPARWERARDILAPLAELAESGEPPPATTLDDAVMRAFSARADDLAPLLAWTHR